MAVSFNKIFKSYKLGKTTLDIINDLTFSIEKGDFLVIKGPSGCGKTTVLRLIAGLTSPDSGQINVLNHPINTMTQEKLALIRSAYIGIVFQDFQLIPTLTCLENAMLPLELAGTTSKGAREIARMELERVGLQNRNGHYPFHLSGGEQQRATWARAFVNNPSLILADEPTANLDVETQNFIFKAFEEVLDDSTITTIVATHESEIEKLATVLLWYDKKFCFKRLKSPPENTSENFEVNEELV
ncbi:MAG: ABC transporter ATP-binding protein [Candidatus Hodarchaeales archaeon]